MKQGWQIKRLGEICDILNGFAFKSNEYVKEGVRVIRITNVQKGKIVDEEPKYFPVKRSNEILKYILQDGDLLMSLTGNVGRVGIIPSSLLPAALNQRVACLRIKDKTISIKYLFHLLNSNLFEKDCISSASGIAQLNMSTKWLEQYEMVIPPPSEQQRIVNLLDAECAKIDALKANAEKNLQNAKDLFQAALKKELEPKEGWNKKQLGEIAEFKNGLNFGKEQGCHKYHFLGVGDFKENTIVETDTLSYIYQDCIDPDYYLKDNDIVFVRSNGSRHLVGRSLLIKSGNEPSVFSGFCIRCRFLSSIVLPQFAMRFFSLNTTKRILTSSGGGCNISNLNQKVLSALEIPFPTSIDEQANIVSRIAQMESHCKNLQANYEKTLSLCNDLKQALLRKAFNGEI